MDDHLAEATKDGIVKAAVAAFAAGQGGILDGNYVVDSLDNSEGVMYIGFMSGGMNMKETLAEAEANWNCRNCGTRIGANSAYRVLYVPRCFGAVAFDAPMRYHSECLTALYEARKRSASRTDVLLGALREAEAAAVAVNAAAGRPVFNPAALAVIREAISSGEGR
jgi:hypothetical protein